MRLSDTGFWTPDGEENSRFVEPPLIKGFPKHSHGRIVECLRFCKDRNSVAVDGGAYIGTWSVELAKHFKQVIAFEPVAESFGCLVANTEGLPVLNYMCALHRDSTPLRMSKGDKFAFSAHVSAERDKTFNVTCVAIDQLYLQSLDLLKLDVEGNELNALHGAVDTIKRHRPVIMIEDKHDTEKKASEFLEKLGMTCVWSKKHDYLFVWK